MNKSVTLAALTALAACGVRAGAEKLEKNAKGEPIGWSLYDGKVLVNANIRGEFQRLFKDAVVSNDISMTVKSTANAALVKAVFPKATEPRLQIDYGFGFSPAAHVTVRRPDDFTIESWVDDKGERTYFYSRMSIPFQRPGVFANGRHFVWTRDIDGKPPAGYFHECYWSEAGDDMQVKVARSMVSIEDAKAKLDAEIPEFLPIKRFVIGAAPSKDAPQPPPPPPEKSVLERETGIINPTAYNIQRTMKTLEEATAENPATVRVLFYGQSITAQDWSFRLMADLRKKYPNVNFIFRNNAIGGYETHALWSCWEWDVTPFYPDLVFLHDYGRTADYGKFLKRLRDTTCAEIILWTSHMRGSGWGSDPVELTKTRDERSLGIIDAAAKYHCMLIDLNRKWARTLIENKWPSNKLLADGIHLNPAGIQFYKRFIEEEIVRIPGADGDADATGPVTLFNPTDKQHAKFFSVQKDGTLEFTFTGNRVTAVSDGTAAADLDAEILLDGKPLAGQKELWAMSRPSSVIMWFPGLRIAWFDATPIEETWTMTILPNPSGDTPVKLELSSSVWGGGNKFLPVRYKIEGSKTGFDGEGSSLVKKFVSKSGRVVIPVEAFSDWPGWLQSAPKPGDTIQWHTYPLFTARLTARPAGTETLILQGCANTTHKLTVKLPKDAKSGIKGFRVWKPSGNRRACNNWDEL